ncbi:expressed unknown protein [Ectocarpus siliculosus]|uniref:Uncharacterized protein n=1 Tax=Ectocarpus siliculosus TaxID=2880 RepID=D7FWA0_ECTSI|nr:expressed unknown protein [Ectocarpus siliculosus]|eukprot:CBJ25620.1 expressed unknown protein [Ectocarpus siliculosus]
MSARVGEAATIALVQRDTAASQLHSTFHSFRVETGAREGRARGRILASPCEERSLSVPARGDGFRRIENPEQQQRCRTGGAGKHPSAVLCLPQPSHGGGAVDSVYVQAYASATCSSAPASTSYCC